MVMKKLKKKSTWDKIEYVGSEKANGSEIGQKTKKYDRTDFPGVKRHLEKTICTTCYGFIG